MKPLLSIVCITYNQEQYIKETIEGFLNQKTNFPIEIIIHDDASRDETPKILKKYADADSRIKLILQTENQYSKGVRIWSKYCFPICRGKYIALCEGDDYWTDPLKLQKQVDFLEENDDYSLCMHTVQRYNQQTNIFTPENEWLGTSTLKDILLQNITYTNAVVFRYNFEAPKWYDESPVGDWPLFVILAKKGKIMKLNETMGVYRIHNEGVWSKLSEIRKIENDIIIYKLFIDNLELEKEDFKALNDKYKKAKKKLRKFKFRKFKNKLKKIVGIQTKDN